MKNSNSFLSFKYYLDDCKNVLEQSISENDIVLFLYSNDFRTKLFMLEGLCKLFSAVYKSQKIDKVLCSIKQLEDAFGSYDYYLSYYNKYNKDEQSPTKIKQYFLEKLEKSKVYILAILNDENWLSGKRIKKIKKTLSKIKWNRSKKECKAIIKVYKKQISKIIAFCKASMPFTDMENHVHELRRKIRWLSIYPQASNGLFRLEKSLQKQTFHNKYFTKEIIQSPFNKFKENNLLKHIIALDTNSFLALSWLINELGKIKDEGLEILAMQEAINAMNLNNKEKQYTAQTLKDSEDKLRSLLQRSTLIMEQYLEEKNLENLLIENKV